MLLRIERKFRRRQEVRFLGMGLGGLGKSLKYLQKSLKHFLFKKLTSVENLCENQHKDFERNFEKNNARSF